MPLDPEALADLVVETLETALAPILDRLAATDRRLEGIARVDGALAALSQDISALRERSAVLETRAPVPGPSGPPGKDGADGLGFDDLAIEQLDDTTVTMKAIRGDQVKVIGSVMFPVVTFKGDYEPGREYTPGNLVRLKSAIWQCRMTTTIAPDVVTHDATGKPAGPQGKDFWTLLIRDGKRGTDGKDGQPGPPGKPGRDWQQVYDDTRRR